MNILKKCFSSKGAVEMGVPERVFAQRPEIKVVDVITVREVAGQFFANGNVNQFFANGTVQRTGYQGSNKPTLREAVDTAMALREQLASEPPYVHEPMPRLKYVPYSPFVETEIPANTKAHEVEVTLRFCRLDSFHVEEEKSGATSFVRGTVGDVALLGFENLLSSEIREWRDDIRWGTFNGRTAIKFWLKNKASVPVWWKATWRGITIEDEPQADEVRRST